MEMNQKVWKKHFSMMLLATVVVSSLVSSGVTFLIFNQCTEKAITHQVVDAVVSERLHTTQIAEVTKASVVSITTIYGDYPVDMEVGFDGLGTGVVLTADGYVLTNSHVVEDGNAQKITAILEDGRPFDATLIWQDRLLDLAVVKIEAENLHPVTFGDSDQLKIGQQVVAIGNPLGIAYSHTVTAGIISGLDRTMVLENGHVIEELIQTDASINEGNSGGPLLNDSGQMIGINTIKITNAEGLGFAIPVNSMKPLIDEIIRMGSISKVELGVRGMEVSTYIKRYHENLPVSQGIYVLHVVLGSSAEAAGLLKGDIILSINGEVLGSQYDLIAILYRYKSGEIVTLEILREGITQQLELQF